MSTMKSVFNFLFLICVITVCSYVDAGEDYRCKLPLEVKKGIPCMAYFPRYGYDIETNECVKFTYGGCGGNENNFYNQAICEHTCKKNEHLTTIETTIETTAEPHMLLAWKKIIS